MIYLDNSATTALSEKVKEAMTAAMECYGNPSSLHSQGDAARHLLKEARETVLSGLGAKGGKLIFTSCGSEASNLAIIGSAMAKSRRTANRIIITDSEHPSVENAVAALEKQGFSVVRIPTCGGKLDFDVLSLSLSEPVFMVSMMQVNNETGAVYDVAAAFDKVRKLYPDVICHCDAVQGFMKLGIGVSGLGADMVTVSGHKIHAPKGVGALWISDRIIKEKRITPLLLGGGQEDGYRSGTENTVGIAAFAAAVSESRAAFDADYRKMVSLRDYARKLLSEMGDKVRLNIPPTAAPHIVSVTVCGIKSQTMLNDLSSRGICVSSGSACSSHSNKPSRTLLAFGLKPEDADCTLRISLSRCNNTSDIEALAAALNEIVESRVHFR